MSEVPLYMESNVSPHGGLRPFHEKATCLHMIDIRALHGANLVTQHPQNRPQRNLRTWGTSLIGNNPSIGPYSRLMPRAL